MITPKTDQNLHEDRDVDRSFVNTWGNTGIDGYEVNAPDMSSLYATPTLLFSPEKINLYFSIIKEEAIE